MTEEAHFEHLDENDLPVEGPAALLLGGFDPEALPAVQALLAEVGATGHRVLLVSRDMLGGTLGAALSTEMPGDPLPAEALPRVAILSGLSGRQIHAIIDSWPVTGLWRPIWASTTPTNLGFGLRDLFRELLAEQRALEARGKDEPPRGP
jgi:hypothetical protein